MALQSKNNSKDTVVKNVDQLAEPVTKIYLKATVIKNIVLPQGKLNWLLIAISC